jgi:hypothetical protein
LSQAGGPRAGLIPSGPPGSPMWLRIRRTGLGRGLCPPCHPLAAGTLRPAADRTLVVRRPRSAVAWAADTRRGHELRVLSPGPRGPLGPWWGTAIFWGSREPGAGGPGPTRMASAP